MRKPRIVIGILVSLLLMLGLALPVAAEVDPTEVIRELAPGESIEVTKTVTVPTLLPTADVVISMDLTASMGGELVNLKTEIDSIIDALAAEATDLNVGIVSHEDYVGLYTSCNYTATYGSSGDEPFRVDYPVGDNFTAASDAVAAMTLGWGVDGPESYARVMWESGQSDSGIGYRADAQKILVMFLDNIPHDCGYTPSTGVDPGRDATANTTDDIDVEDDAIPAMTGEDITQLVVFSGFAPQKSIWDTITGATGGSAVQISANGTVPGGMSLTELILELISEVETDVWWEVTSVDPGLTVELTPDVHSDVSGGSTVRFTETITVAKDATQCTTLKATVTFLANNYTGPDSEGIVIGEQEISIKVKDVEAPTVSCVETVNPHGKNVPGGKASGKGKGVNPDGFYQLLAEDNCPPPPHIWVGTACNAMLFGPFRSGTVVKFTEAPGAAPSMKKMGSTKGQAGAVSWHITLPSDPVIWAVDAAGHKSDCVGCLVPPPPK